MPPAYRCDHPACTGVHGHDRPAREQCPEAIRRQRASEARYKASAKGMLMEVRRQAQRRGNR